MPDSLSTISTTVKELAAASAPAAETLAEAAQPVVLRGIAEDWALTRQSASGPAGAAAYLKPFYNGRHPKLSTEQGKPLFLPKGGNSDYLNRISSILAVIHNGVQVTSDMVSMWHSMGLLEPMTVDIELVDGSKHTLGGHFAVSEEKVAALSATDLHTLHQHNYLQGLYLAMTSLNNLQTLIDLKNIRIHQELRAYA